MISQRPFTSLNALALLLIIAATAGCRRGSEPAAQPDISISGNASSGTESTAGDQRSRAVPVLAESSHQQAARNKSNPYFSDVTEQTGINFQYQNGRAADEYVILESLGGGVGVADGDGDGWMDLCFAGGGKLDARNIVGLPCGYFRNDGSMRFVECTEASGMRAERYFTHGVFPGDFDSDGFSDYAITGFGGVQLYKNQGDGTFAEMEGSGLSERVVWSSSAAWGDYNDDGHLDLYLAQYVTWSWAENPLCFDASGKKREVCAPGDFRGLDDIIFFSDGAGGFVDVTAEVGLARGGKGLGVVSADLDGDGDTDIYVANDTTDNHLYVNDGEGKFTEQAILAGVSGDDVGVNTGSMGIAVGDSNSDGLPDIWVTNFERELFALYRNEGEGLFTHASRTAGLSDLGGLYVGFGTTFVDIDHDLDEDLVVANGHVSYHSNYATYEQPALLLENIGQGRFKRMDVGGYFQERRVGRGLAKGDLDNDGCWDLIFCNSESPAAILRGQVERTDKWVSVQLIGKLTNRDAIGATIQVEMGGKRLCLSRSGGGSYLSQSDARFLFPVPKMDESIIAKVTWGSGREETFLINDDQPRHQQWIEGFGVGAGR